MIARSKNGKEYEIVVSSHDRAPGYDAGQLLNASSVWVLFDGRWFPSRAKSMVQAKAYIESCESLSEILSGWGLDYSDTWAEKGGWRRASNGAR
jgi:hypothetical protein